MKLQSIVKRDGRRAPFAAERIASAVHKALLAVGTDDPALADELALVVVEHLERVSDQPEIVLEDVQDAVVHVLQESGHYRAAIAYARYRDERERRRRSDRADGASDLPPNLIIREADGRGRRFSREWVGELIQTHHHLDDGAVTKVLQALDEVLAGTAVDELTMPVLLSLIDAALVRSGMVSVATRQGALRVERTVPQRLVGDGRTGDAVLREAGRALLRQWSGGNHAQAVLHHYGSGRLWFDGFDDPRRGSQFTAVLDGIANPWQLLAAAFALAHDAGRSWRRVRLVLPPILLGHLERGAKQFLQPLTALAEQAEVYLACDGRTPLLSEWPLPRERTRHPVSIAVAHDDFLVLRRLQELNLPLLAGPHLFAPGWRGRVAVESAVNAQGLDGEFAALDQLARALVAAARQRIDELAALAQGAEARFAIFGLAPHGDACAYLERQIQQESLRAGIDLRRHASLSEDACAHLGRLLGSA